MTTSKIMMSQLPKYLSQLEHEIRSPDVAITPEKYIQIHQELDVALAVIEKGTSTKALPLKDRIVAICGELENRLEQDQLQAIQKTADQLAQLVENYKKDHLPSLSDKKILSRASELLSSTDIKSLETQTDAEHIFDLLEMARAVYNKEIGSARKIYLSLPESLQLEFGNHMKHLMATPFDDTHETLQALTLMSGALTGSSSSPYPNSNQIDLFFLGIPEEDPIPVQTGKIIAFDANRQKRHG